MHMAIESRRSFNQKMLGSLVTLGLIETLYSHDLFAAAVKPVVHKWFVDLHSLSQDLKNHKLKDADFQTKLETLYKRVDLAALIQLIELDRVTKDLKYPAKGARNLGIDLSKVEGLPKKLVFGKQIFALRKGRSIVPHGHDNMCTGFIILRGNFQGKHYDRVADHKDHYLIKPTIDRAFQPGECSTISDHKDNVHWFQAASDHAFIFNVHIMGYNTDSKKVPRRVYVDPVGEKVSGGLIVAKKISSADCHKKYG
jgi:hypothetical protein